MMGETSFLNFVLLTLLFAIAGNAFQPYYHHRWRQHSYRRANILDQQNFHYRWRRRLVQLSYAPTDPSIIEHNRQYLSDKLGFSEQKLDKLAAPTSNCNILTLDIGILDDRVNWLQNLLNLTDNEIKKMIQKEPTILGKQSDTGLAPKIDWLQERLVLDQKSLAKMIIKQPTILTCSIDDNIEPTLSWLQKHLVLDDTALSKTIQRLPSILYLSIEDNIEPKLEWLQDQLQLDDVALSKMIKRLPSILGMSISDNMEPKLNWLQKRLSLTDEELSEIIQRYPALLTLNVEGNLEPTLCFYIDALGKEEALALVTGDPSAFGRSLEKRLKPRLERALDVGMIIDSKLLSLIIKYTDDQWNRKVTKRMGKTAYQ